MRLPRGRSILTHALLALLLLGPCTAARAGEFDRHFSLAGDELTLVNLIGMIQLEPAQGSTFEVDVQVRGDDAQEDLITFEHRSGTRAKLIIGFPIDQEDRYVYPEMGRGSKTRLTPRGERKIKGLWDLLGIAMGRSIEVRGRGRGLELWADVTIKVPRGASVVVTHGVGDIHAQDIEGNLVLDSANGEIMVLGVTGDVLADTGSGAVGVGQVTGEVTVDTGSGSVEIARCEGEMVSIDTGSGSVRAEEIRCQKLQIDTGSGRVRAYAIEADAADIDTGSGSVVLELDRMGAGRFRIDTGSGSIELRLPDDASAEISADSGSGSISVDVGDTRVRKDDELSLRIGTGAARVVLDAGSGSISIRG